MLVEHDCLTSQQIATLLHISGRVEQKSEATASKKARATFWMPDGAKKNARISGTERPEDDMEWVVYAL